MATRSWLTSLIQAPLEIKKGQIVPMCTGFGWDRVNSLPSSWYCAGFRVWDENDVDNAGMLWLLLRSPYTESKTARLLTVPRQRGGRRCTGSWRGRSQDGIPGLFRTVWRHAHRMNGGSWPGGGSCCWGRAGRWSVHGEQLHCASLVLHSSLLLLLFLPFLFN